jgi:signal transduction histidine kinase
VQLGMDVQDLSHRLHSSKLDSFGIAVAARSFCKELSEKQKVVVEFSHERVPGSLPNEVSLCLFRVLQEALQNAVKYSGAQHFRVELRGTSTEIRLTVSDGGVGFDQQEAMNRQGFGAHKHAGKTATGERLLFHRLKAWLWYHSEGAHSPQERV